MKRSYCAFLHFVRIFAWRHAANNPGSIRVSRILAFLHEIYKGIFGFIYHNMNHHRMEQEDAP